jgi:hypothetical protein
MVIPVVVSFLSKTCILVLVPHVNGASNLVPCLVPKINKNPNSNSGSENQAQELTNQNRNGYFI